MKQLLILSGKGGTGKTTIAGAFIELSGCNAYADCDVDAPNLDLILKQDVKPVKTDYFGFQKAVIDDLKCIKCGLCESSCHFRAIKNCKINVMECEGCGVCFEICPEKAISMVDYSSGSLLLYKGSQSVFSTAQLKTGSGASGKLVSAVKKQLVKEAGREHLVIIDGSPGTGCPVIASISGADMVLVVAEPSVSGIHDMKRIIETVGKFNAGCTVCINKFDINTDKTKEIEEYCRSLEIPVAGRIPFDKTVIKAVNESKSIVSYPDSCAAKAIAAMWEKLI